MTAHRPPYSLDITKDSYYITTTGGYCYDESSSLESFLRGDTYGEFSTNRNLPIIID